MDSGCHELAEYIWFEGSKRPYSGVEIKWGMTPEDGRTECEDTMFKMGLEFWKQISQKKRS